MTPRRHLALGLLFLFVVGLLGYYTLFKTDTTFFGEKTRITAYAEHGGGLRKGAQVLYAGVRWGQVDEVMPDIDRPLAKRVRIVISLDQPIRLFRDHEAVIEAASVLGGVQLSLDPGSPGQPEVDLSEPLMVRRSLDVLESLGSLVEENRETIRNTLASIEEVVTNVRNGNAVVSRLFNDDNLGLEVSNAVASISKTFANTEQLTDELRGGRGTLGRLIYDAELYDDIRKITGGVQKFVEDASGFLNDARNGQGLIATLLNDGEAATDVKGALASVRSIAEKLDRGEGTLARLLNDGEIATSLQSAAEKISEFMTNVLEGEGTIAKLVKDGRLYDTALTFMGDLADASEAIRTQRGTVGRLIYDDTVIRQLERVFGTLQGTLEEAREAAPIATFVNTLFLGF